MGKYEDSARFTNKKYDAVIERLTTAVVKYNGAINKLDSVTGVKKCNSIKADLITKREELKNKIEEIESIKKTLISNGRKKDAERRRRELEAQQQNKIN